MSLKLGFERWLEREEEGRVEMSNFFWQACLLACEMGDCSEIRLLSVSLPKPNFA